MSLRGTKDVSYLTSDEIPEEVKEAMVSIEDKKFYSHGGIDFKAIIRAVWAMVRNGEVTQGGSTITQQLIKNNVFPDFVNESTFEEKLERKIQEQYLAIQVEKQLDKVRLHDVSELDREYMREMMFVMYSNPLKNKLMATGEECHI